MSNQIVVDAVVSRKNKSFLLDTNPKWRSVRDIFLWHHPKPSLTNFCEPKSQKSTQGGMEIKNVLDFKILNFWPFWLHKSLWAFASACQIFTRACQASQTFVDAHKPPNFAIRRSRYVHEHAQTVGTMFSFIASSSSRCDIDDLFMMLHSHKACTNALLFV